MVAAIEQIVLILARRGKALDEFGINKNMTGRAGTAAAAQGEQFVKAVVAACRSSPDRSVTVILIINNIPPGEPRAIANARP